MSNYNNGKYISQAINSVINQTCENWELVIIDDASTDNSNEIISKYQEDPRIIYCRNKKNLGYIDTLKKLIELARADIVGILDSDDALMDSALKEIIKTYKKNSYAIMVYTQCYYCDSDLTPKHLGFSAKIKKGKSNLHCNVIHHFKTFKKEAYQKTLGYDNEIIYAEDIDIELKLEELGMVYFLDKPLYNYRILPKSQTHSFRNTQINRSSTALAKFNAYQRRLGTSIPNLSKPEINEVLFWGIINSALALRLKLFVNFIVNIFSIDYLFFIDPRFYKLIFKKVKKIIQLKKEKPLLKI